MRSLSCTAALLWGLVAGCGFDSSGLTGGSAGLAPGDGSSGTDGGLPTTTIEPPGASGAPDPGGMGTTAAPEPTGTTAQDPSLPSGSSGPWDEPSLPASCLELRESQPDLGDGIYELDGLTAYCDMTTEGGGWTLVARSVAGGQGEFGWRVSRGELDAEATPYSVDIGSLPPFSEILIGDYAEGRQWGAHVYRIFVPELSSTVDAVVETNEVATVQGDCSPSEGPQIFRFFGYTERTDRFFFRDVGAVDSRIGLWPGGFDTWWDSGNWVCEIGGDISGQQGMLLVR